MNKIKAIITDLDRTLLHTDKSVSRYTLDILKKCHERGILVMAASARPMRAITDYDNIIKFDGITTLNGGVTILPDRKSEIGIEKKNVKKMISYFMRYDDAFISVEASTAIYSNKDVPAWHPIIFDRFPQLPDDEYIYKILVSSTDNALYEEINGILTDDVYSSIAQKDLIQIMNKKATKWNGIKEMISYYNISAEEVLFFGDDNDDLEPIIKCGTGVAVSNAIPSVFEAADKVTTSNDEDGVARFIEENII
ncbi:MAG: HAD family hydrolase [Ruminococcaceae bacterium]|nr:HAD family hydrolase [Oscillospiraceae bacterium]